MQIGEWSILYTKIFQIILLELERDVLAISSIDPVGYRSHPKTKLLQRVFLAITVDVPADPNNKKFRLGSFLGERYKSWRRVKDGLPDRYRLFFQFLSTDKKIIYAWINDENTLRKNGSRTDVYRAFKRLVDGGKIQNDYKELVRHSVSP